MSRVDQVLVTEPHVVFDPVINVFVATKLLELEQFHHLPRLDKLSALTECELLHSGQYLLGRLAVVTDATETEVLESVHHSKLIWSNREAHHWGAEVERFVDGVCTAVGYEHVKLFLGEDLPLGHPFTQENVGQIGFFDMLEGVQVFL